MFIKNSISSPNLLNLSKKLNFASTFLSFPPFSFSYLFSLLLNFFFSVNQNNNKNNQKNSKNRPYKFRNSDQNCKFICENSFTSFNNKSLCTIFYFADVNQIIYSTCSVHRTMVRKVEAALR